MEAKDKQYEKPLSLNMGFRRFAKVNTKNLIQSTELP